MRRTGLVVIAAAAAMLVAPIPAGAQEMPSVPKGPADRGGYIAEVNGLELYYEIHGTGRPLVLLHGGLQTIDMAFGEWIRPLAETRQVVPVELQGHGRTAETGRPMRYELMADDVAALLRHLGFEEADVLGFSLGGGVALQTAIRHPEVVRKLVLVSAPFRSDGWYAEVLEAIGSLDAEDLAGSPWHTAYVSTAPRPQDWPTLVANVSGLISGRRYDWTDGVASLDIPSLLLVGDGDSIRPAHAVELYELLGGGAPGDLRGLPASQLAVLPGTAHTDPVGILSRLELVLPIIRHFLNAPMPGDA